VGYQINCKNFCQGSNGKHDVWERTLRRCTKIFKMTARLTADELDRSVADRDTACDA
jgi:hypothetical protein